MVLHSVMYHVTALKDSRSGYTYLLWWVRERGRRAGVVTWPVAYLASARVLSNAGQSKEE
jgi:hypothetical protein